MSKTKFTVVFRSNAADYSFFLDFNDTEKSFGAVQARARQIVNSGVLVPRHDGTSMFASPHQIIGVVIENIKEDNAGLHGSSDPA